MTYTQNHHGRLLVISSVLISLTAALTMLLPGSRHLKGSLTDVHVLETCDTNGDRVFSMREMKSCIRNMIALQSRNFPAYDLDGNGVVERADLRILIQSLRAFLSASCGNGVIETVEECDDGNQDNTDLCSNSCKNAVCGNRVREATEECDDGNSNEVDDCSSACKRPVCGNGIREGYTLEPYEECDDGNQINTDSCTTSCREPVCGDGYKQGTEECDDGNTVNFDECSNKCIAAACNATVPFAYDVQTFPSPNAMVLGKDGALWVAGGHSNNASGTPIGKITKISSTGSATHFRVDASVPFGNDLESIAVAPDGNMWLSDGVSNDGRTNLIRKISAAGTVSAFPVTDASSSQDITVGPDGNIWFTVQGFGGGGIGKMSAAGVVLGKYQLPSGSYPYSIVTGPDNNLWFTDRGANKIGKMTTAGVLLAEYDRPTNSDPWDIAKGPDGNIWFTEMGRGKIVKMSVTGEVLLEIALAEGSQPLAIISGPNGRMWFTEWAGKKIGNVTMNGAVSEFTTPYDSPVFSIATGKDGNIYYNGGSYGVGKLFVCQ